MANAIDFPDDCKADFSAGYLCRNLNAGLPPKLLCLDEVDAVLELVARAFNRIEFESDGLTLARQ